ncbi:MAG: ribonuclease PH, partial [bacterium]
MMRHDGRQCDHIRTLTIDPFYLSTVPYSVLISMGDTRVLCCATLDRGVPSWLKGQGKGWVTAEYGMLPRSCNDRIQRERKSVSGRTQEIQRLIGRSLRASIDLVKLGEKQIMIDCDVIQADGGTRTASITGGFVALNILINDMLMRGDLKENPI